MGKKLAIPLGGFLSENAESSAGATPLLDVYFPLSSISVEETSPFHKPQTCMINICVLFHNKSYINCPPPPVKHHIPLSSSSLLSDINKPTTTLRLCKAVWLLLILQTFQHIHLRWYFLHSFNNNCISDCSSNSINILKSPALRSPPYLLFQDYPFLFTYYHYNRIFTRRADKQL